MLHQTLLLDDQIKEDEMDRACSMRGRDEKCIQNFSQETLREQPT